MWASLIAGALVAIGYPAGRWFYVRHLETACREAFRAKDWPRLLATAARYTSWRPDRAQPWMYRAQAAHELGQLEDAAKFLDQMPDRDPRTAEALLERATLLFGPLNRPLEGEQTCRRALRLNPTLIEGYRRLIYFYAFTLQRQKMVQQIRDAMEWDCDQPETYIYLLAQDWLSFGNAYAENTRWMKSDPESELFLVGLRSEPRATRRASTGARGWPRSPINQSATIADSRTATGTSSHIMRPSSMRPPPRLARGMLKGL